MSGTKDTPAGRALEALVRALMERATLRDEARRLVLPTGGAE